MANQKQDVEQTPTGDTQKVTTTEHRNHRGTDVKITDKTGTYEDNASNAVDARIGAEAKKAGTNQPAT